MQTDIVIIGAGPVGLFAAFQAGMLGMKCHIIDSLKVIGGQCTTLYPEKPIYDIPAYPKIIAADLVEQLAKQTAPFNHSYHLDQQVVNLLPEEDQDFRIFTAKNLSIKAKVVVIATGPGFFRPNKPPLEGIENFEGKSIFYFVDKRERFADKVVVIAGGGDSAVDWAISLAEVAKKIYLIHRRDKFRAAPESVRQLTELARMGKAELVIPYQLEQLIGSNGYLETITIKDFDGGIRRLEADILLPCFGLAQDLGPIFQWGINIKSNHIVVEYPHCQTSTHGIYAIGDIASYPGKLKLILTGFAEAAACMHHAYSKVFAGKALHFQHSTTKGIP